MGGVVDKGPILTLGVYVKMLKVQGESVWDEMENREGSSGGERTVCVCQ